MIKAPESNEFNKGIPSLFEGIGATLVITLKVVTFLLCFEISNLFLSLKIRRNHGKPKQKRGVGFAIKNGRKGKKHVAKCQPHHLRVTKLESKRLFFFTVNTTNENTLLTSPISLILSVFFVHARTKEPFKHKVCPLWLHSHLPLSLFHT